MRYLDEDQTVKPDMQLSLCFDEEIFKGRNLVLSQPQEHLLGEGSVVTPIVSKKCEVLDFNKHRTANLEAQLVRKILHRSRFF